MDARTARVLHAQEGLGAWLASKHPRGRGGKFSSVGVHAPALKLTHGEAEYADDAYYRHTGEMPKELGKKLWAAVGAAGTAPTVSMMAVEDLMKNTMNHREIARVHEAVRRSKPGDMRWGQVRASLLGKLKAAHADAPDILDARTGKPVPRDILKGSGGVARSDSEPVMAGLRAARARRHVPATANPDFIADPSTLRHGEKIRSGSTGRVHTVFSVTPGKGWEGVKTESGVKLTGRGPQGYFMVSPLVEKNDPGLVPLGTLRRGDHYKLPLNPHIYQHKGESIDTEGRIEAVDAEHPALRTMHEPDRKVLKVPPPTTSEPAARSTRVARAKGSGYVNLPMTPARSSGPPPPARRSRKGYTNPA